MKTRLMERILGEGRAMDTMIIEACLKAGRGRGDNPNVPWAPGDVAEEAANTAQARGMPGLLPFP